MKKRPAAPVLAPDSSLIDSHCHLDMTDYQNIIDEVLTSALSCGITKIITIGIDLASSRKAVGIADRYSGIYASVGIHPHSAEDGQRDVYQELQALSAHHKVVGWGEIGLDYAKEYAPLNIQKKTFSRQLELAKELSMPVIIHDRDAHDDTLKLLQENGPFDAGGVMHCFSGDVIFARQILDLGFYISIPGIVTFKNAHDLQQVVQEIPLERMLLETDGPFLAPVPWRGKPNRPEYLLYTADKVAQLKNISLDETARQTRLNTERLFSLPQREDAA